MRLASVMQVLEGVRGALREGTLAVAAQAAAVVRAVIEELAEHCAGVLKQLRGITATYRCLPCTRTIFSIMCCARSFKGEDLHHQTYWLQRVARYMSAIYCNACQQEAGTLLQSRATLGQVGMYLRGACLACQASLLYGKSRGC